MEDRIINKLFSRVAVLCGALALGACSAFGGKAAPEPEYTQVQASAPFEIRDYPELVLVKTTMNGADDPAFMRLFRYISGENSGKREIAMTAPVLESPKGEEIAMTAPVLQSGADGATEMSFILTAEFTPETAPLPNDPAVLLDTIPARRVAVISFNGQANQDLVAEHQTKLQDWMAAQGLVAKGPAELAQYNPPLDDPVPASERDHDPDQRTLIMHGNGWRRSPPSRPVSRTAIPLDSDPQMRLPVRGFFRRHPIRIHDPLDL